MMGLFRRKTPDYLSTESKNIKAGKGRPDDNELIDSEYGTIGSSRISGGSNASYTYEEPAGANNLRDEIRLQNLERQYAHFGNPPGYDQDWAEKEHFIDWDEYWAREGVKTKQGFFKRESDAEHLAKLILKENPDITIRDAVIRFKLHPDKMPDNLKSQANDTLAVLGQMIAKRDKKK
jgi:hypothetical protein